MSKRISISAILIDETPNAIKLLCGDEKVWFHKSNVEYDVDNQLLTTRGDILHAKLLDKSIAA